MLLILLGLKNPSGNLDALISFTLFSYIVFTLLKTGSRKNIFIAIALGLAITAYLFKNLSLMPYVMLAIGFGWFTYLWLRKISKKRPIFKIILIIISFFLLSLINSPGLRNYLSISPQPGTYRTDMDDFLRTHYLMKQGLNYYQSYKLAINQNPFKSSVPENIWSWRLPTVFYLWKFVSINQSHNIYYLFLIFSGLTLYLSYKILTLLLPIKDKDYAILAPFLIIPYFVFASRDTTILQTEWWAVFPMIAALYFDLKNKPWLAALMYSLTVITRELFIIPIAILALVNLISNRKKLKIYVIPIFIFIFAVVLHSQFVIQYISSTDSLVAPRIHQLGGKIILATLAFGSWEYIFFRFRIFVLAHLLALLGVINNFSKNIFWVISFLSFPLSFLIIGSSTYNDYWGIFYVPFILMAAPLALSHGTSITKLYQKKKSITNYPD